MDESTNYYELLGVSRKASQPEIKAAYKDLARVFHPDSNFYDEILGGQSGRSSAPQTDVLFQRITAAYEVLSNVDRRQEYDESLPQGLRGWEDAVVDRSAHIERMKAAMLQKSFGKAPVQRSAFSSLGEARRSVGMSQVLRHRRSAWSRVRELLGFG